jgi:shikimate kinase
MALFLVGYRGSGKTTVGRHLAERFGCAFCDTDEVIITRAGKTIAQIFAEGGEASFREMESEALSQVLGCGRAVVGTGGGIILRPANRALMKVAGGVVYLQCSPEELFRRIQQDGKSAANRPSLSKLGGSLDEVREILAAREPLYREVADHVVMVEGRSVAEVVEEIWNLKIRI